jgi:hypothetical protein
MTVSSAGVISLTAGKTYQFDAGVALTGTTGYLTYSLTDSGGTPLANAPAPIVLSMDNAGSSASSLGTFSFVYTATTNQSVKFRVLAGPSGNPVIDATKSYFRVTQLGTSALTSDSVVAVGGNQLAGSGSVLNIGTTNNNLLQFIASSSIGAGLAYATNSGAATTTTFFVGTSSPTTSLFSGIAMYINGAIARTFGSNFATSTPYAHNVVFGDTSRVRVLATTSAFIGITGIAGGSDGEELTLVNASSTASFTLYDHTSTTTSSAANRIITGTGSNLTLAGDASINLVYDATASTTGRWRVVGGSGSGGSTSMTSLTNFTASSSIGTAALTVDTYGTINIAQASSSVVLTLPNPTITTAGKTITVFTKGSY